MSAPVRNFKIDKLFGPSFSFSGYAFIVAGLLTVRFSPSSIALVIVGALISFTTTGTLIDTDKRRIKSYTMLFGIVRAGHWIEIENSYIFKISKSKRRYTTYSRANLANNLYISDIKLELAMPATGKKIIVNRYKYYEDASREMNELSDILNLKHEVSQ